MSDSPVRRILVDLSKKKTFYAKHEVLGVWQADYPLAMDAYDTIFLDKKGFCGIKIKSHKKSFAVCSAYGHILLA